MARFSPARFRTLIAAFIKKHSRTTGHARVQLSDEAKTSVFVFLCLYELLGHDPFGEIVPQSTSHGFIDYELLHRGRPTGCRVEVKKFTAPLKPDHIKKYLVRRGRQDRNFRVGVLTNLRQWHVYGYMPMVATREPVLVLQVDGQYPRALRELEEYLSASAARGRFKFLRRRYAEAGAVAAALVSSTVYFPKIAPAIRRRLKTLKRGVVVPRNDGLQLTAWYVVNGHHWSGRNANGLTYHEMRNALCSVEFTEDLARSLRSRVGAPVSKHAVRRNLREWIDRKRSV